MYGAGARQRGARGKAQAVLLEGRVREEGAVMSGRGQLCRDAGQGAVLMPLATSSKACLPIA